MNKELHSSILGDVTARTQWEQKQRIWYRMRHDGLRRKNKPYPHASDLHFPLADTQIEKHKPYFYMQIFQGELLASFAALKSEMQEFAEHNAQWFDYQLKQLSNFQPEMMHLVDYLTVGGKCPLKILWNASKEKLEFDAVDPVYAIAPAECKDLQTTDRFCHVIHLSKYAYKQNDLFNQDPALIKRIVGTGESNQEITTNYNEKQRREGITYSTNPDQIIIWEEYEASKDGWKVHTVSPSVPGEDVRDPFIMNLNHDELPFVDFNMEIKDKGYYSPRGICEKVAPFEAYACKNWNLQGDMLSFTSQPLFKNTKNQTNPTNWNFVPGSILPQGLEPAHMGKADLSLAQEIDFTRRVAEDLVQTPDLGIGDRFTKQRQTTAREIDARERQGSQGVDLKAIIFRMGLARAYGQAWRILIKFKKQELLYQYRSSMVELDPRALVDAFGIMPDGSPDNWNKQLKQREAWGLFDKFNKDPFIKQGWLRKQVLEAHNPIYVKEAFIDAQDRAADETEEQAQELTVLAMGFPARVTEDDDHLSHAQTIIGFVEKTRITGQLPSKDAVVLILQHFKEHTDYISKSDNGEQIAQNLINALNQVMQPQPNDAIDINGASAQGVEEERMAI